MNYDWEKIFKKKTNKELYEIVTGKVVLSKEAVDFAKLELENRDFDFSKIDTYQDVWKIGNLISDEEFSRYNDRSIFFSFKLYVFIIAGIILISFIINKYTNFELSLNLILVIIVYVTFAILLENFVYKKKKRIREKRIKKTYELKQKLENEKVLNEDNPVYKELIRFRESEREKLEVWMRVFLVVMLIALIIGIIKIFIMFY